MYRLRRNLRNVPRNSDRDSPPVLIYWVKKHSDHHAKAQGKPYLLVNFS